MTPVVEIDLPEVRTEVEAAFARYEQALVGNDVATLNELFWPDRRTIRYGIGENLYGHAAIEAFRAARDARGLARILERTVMSAARAKPGCAPRMAGGSSPPTSR
jgi:hypothetical protein